MKASCLTPNPRSHAAIDRDRVQIRVDQDAIGRQMHPLGETEPSAPVHLAGAWAGEAAGKRARLGLAKNLQVT